MSTTTRLDLGLATAGLDDDCGCGGGGCGGGTAVSERPRWFAGQLVGPGDLEAMQQWVLGRSRRHNRLIHGWGVACGLAVDVTTAPTTGELVPWSVTVTPGYALSACGDEVGVPTTVRIDIRQPRPAGADVCAPPVDPWCAPVRERRDPERTYYLAIRYAEQLTHPVRATGCGCGCGDDACEPSRVTETYALAILDELPDCYEERRAEDYQAVYPDAASSSLGVAGIREAFGCTPEIRRTGTRSCPDCCSPWVVLADLTVDSAGTVTVDPLTHRRFLPSLGSLAFTCEPSTQSRRELGQAEMSALRSSFASGAVDVVDDAQPESALAAPAVQLRGGSRSRQLRTLLGDRTVAELARADVAALSAAGQAVGIDPEDVDHLHSLAMLVTRLVTS